MTSIIVINSIAAAVVILGLAVCMRLGHHAAGGRFERTLRRFELHHGERAPERETERRAA